MLYAIVTAVLAVAWVPLFFRFLRGWRHRKNPVSLAICAMISYLIYTNVIAAFTTLGMGSWRTERQLTLLFNGLVLINFYLSFRWSEQRFPDARRATAASDVSKDP